MAYNFIIKPTGDFKIDQAQSPNGKDVTLKGVRTVKINEINPDVTNDQDGNQFNAGLRYFFQIFGINDLQNRDKGTRTEKSILSFTSG